MKLRIEIDGREAEVEAGSDLLSACLGAGVEVPHFCWHAALGSVGACRLCAVKVQDGPEAAPRLEMACMCAAKEGQRVSVADPEAEAFRAHVVEWLMLNHPHDCAVCEEGGSCHLQDMTVATAHRRRRYRFDKRTHRNRDLGPLLRHEMNRCIACWRCTRFYRDYAGGRDLDAFGAHDRLWFGPLEDGPLESPFAGNLAEVCPTGVFVDRAWSRVYARTWDMRATPSVCAHCSVGCNVTLSERGGVLRKVDNRRNGAVNGWFLCDRGRYGPHWVEGPAALRTPRVNGAPASPAEAMAAARAALADGAIGLGSPRASLESNWALRRLVGPKRFFAAQSDAEARLTARMADLLRTGQGASLADMESADAALVLGEDLTGFAPRAALALRQMTRGAERALAAEKGVDSFLDAAVRTAGEGRRSPLVLVTPLPDALDDVATLSLRRTPEDAARFGRAVAAALGGEPAEPEAARTAQFLASAETPLIVAGAGADCPETVEAAAEILAALGAKARLALFPAGANALGLALLHPMGGLEAAAAALADGPGTLVVLEADALLRADTVVLLDAVETEAAKTAQVVLPTAPVTDAAGTFVNHEGRAQRFHAARPPEAPAAWRLLTALADAPETTLPALHAALIADRPDLAAIAEAAPAPGETPAVARAPAGFSARTASDEAGRLAAAVPPEDPDSPLSWSMEGARGAAVPPSLRTGATAPGLHSASAVRARPEDATGVLLTPAAAPLPPAAPRPEGRGLLRLPLHDPFAASETDRASPPLAARAPGPRVLLHPEDAAALGLAEGAALRLDGRPAPHRLVLSAAVPRGAAAVTGGPRLGPRRIAVEAAP